MLRVEIRRSLRSWVEQRINGEGDRVGRRARAKSQGGWEQGTTHVYIGPVMFQSWTPGLHKDPVRGSIPLVLPMRKLRLRGIM